MKSLYLLRHAKSAWDDPAPDDFDRSLAKRGVKAAKRMARAMAEAGLVPDAVFCSQAARTRETWDLMAPRLDGAIAIKHLKSLYLATPSRLYDVLRRQPSATGALMIVGHNPGLHRLALDLAGNGSDSDALARLRSKFPTAALAHFDFDIRGWDEVAARRGRLVRFLRPKDLS